MGKLMKIVPNELVFLAKEEAELVLERMNDIIKAFKVVYVADLKNLVGLPTTYVDNKWGWIDLRECANSTDS